MKITGTFLDEISYDIPHQNWGEKEWDTDFRSMKAIGIDTVILIRCGLRQSIAFPSEVLMKRVNALEPFCDLTGMFLRLAEKYQMKFYFGTYDCGLEPEQIDFQNDLETNKRVVEEAWKRYGHCPAFGGWYLSREVSRSRGRTAEGYAKLGSFCKEISNGLPVLISPFIQGVKANAELGINAGSIALEQHEKEWDNIFSMISGSVDTIAFQDGHVEIHELQDYLKINIRHALRGTLRHDLRIGRRIRIVHLRQEALKCEVASLLAARVLLAQVAAHAAYSADLADCRPLVGIVAEHVYRRRSRNQLDHLLGTYRDALSAADAKALVNLREPVVY